MNALGTALNRIGDQISGGKLDGARRALKAIWESREKELFQHPSYHLQTATLFRRAGLPQLGVALLHSAVRPIEGRRIAHRSATPEEKLEYAANLIRLDLLSEAEDILSKAEVQKLPRSHFFSALRCMHDWNHREGVSHLTRYLSHPELGIYERSVAKLNLYACLVQSLDFQQARELRFELLHEIQNQRAELLALNHKDITLQMLLLSGADEEAETLLGTVPDFSDADNLTWDELQIVKHHAVLNLYQNPGNMNPLRKAFVEKAFALGYHESVRDFDLYALRLTGDSKIARRLYHGTPSASFREKIIPWMSDTREVIEHPIREPDHEDSLEEHREWEWEWEKELKPGQLLHRLFGAFLEDFYKPPSLFQLHTHAFPGDFFNPNSSPNRCHQALKRLRAWLKKSVGATTIRERRERYVLSSPHRLRKPITRSSEDYHLSILAELPARFHSKNLSDQLDCSPARAHQLLSEWRSKAWVEMKGSRKTSQWIKKILTKER